MNGDDIMEAKLQKWGNSDGIRIPKSILKSLNLKTNDKVDLIQEQDKIIISRPVKKHRTIEERFEEFNNLPNEEKGKAEGYDWGNDLGKEIFD